MVQKGASSASTRVPTEEDFSDASLERWRNSKPVKQALKEVRNLSLDQLVLRLEQICAQSSALEEQYVSLHATLDTEVKFKEVRQQDLEKINKAKTTLDRLLVKLQKTQQELIEENKRITEQESQKRQEMAKSVQVTISDVKDKMEEQAEERLIQERESEKLRLKFRQLVDHYEEREKFLADQQRQREEEVRTLEQDLQKKEQNAQAVLQQARHLLQANKGLARNEVQLRSQLKQYGEKLGAFQKTLTNSHLVFQQYKQELAKLREAKKRMDADKERFLIKCKDLDGLEEQKVQLEELCRASRST